MTWLNNCLEGYEGHKSSPFDENRQNARFPNGEEMVWRVKPPTTAVNVCFASKSIIGPGCGFCNVNGFPSSTFKGQPEKVEIAVGWKLLRIASANPGKSQKSFFVLFRHSYRVRTGFEDTWFPNELLDPGFFLEFRRLSHRSSRLIFVLMQLLADVISIRSETYYGTSA